MPSQRIAEAFFGGEFVFERTQVTDVNQVGMTYAVAPAPLHAPGGGWGQSREDAQQRRLAAAVRSRDEQRFAGGHTKRDAGEHSRASAHGCEMVGFDHRVCVRVAGHQRTTSLITI